MSAIPTRRSRRPRPRSRCRPRLRRHAEKYWERRRCRSITTGTAATGSRPAHRGKQTRARRGEPDNPGLLPFTGSQTKYRALQSRTPAGLGRSAHRSTSTASPFCSCVHLPEPSWLPDRAEVTGSDHRPSPNPMERSQSEAALVSREPTGENAGAEERRIGGGVNTGRWRVAESGTDIPALR